MFRAGILGLNLNSALLLFDGIIIDWDNFFLSSFSFSICFLTKIGVCNASSLLNLPDGVFGVCLEALPELSSLNGDLFRSRLMNLLEDLTGPSGDIGRSAKSEMASLIIREWLAYLITGLRSTLRAPLIGDGFSEEPLPLLGLLPIAEISSMASTMV